VNASVSRSAPRSKRSIAHIKREARVKRDDWTAGNETYGSYGKRCS
jgi:hypothetical protein